MQGNTEPTPTASSIDRIEQLVLSAQGALETAITDALGYATDDVTPVVALPGRYKLHNVEQFARRRARMRAAFATHRLADFAAYVSRVGQQAPTESRNHDVMVDIDTLSASIVLDAGTAERPLHCDHRATLKLRPTSLWTALLKINGQRLPQRQVLDFLEDWRLYWPHALPSIGEEAQDPIAQAAALTALRSVKLDAKATTTHAENNLQRQRTALEQIEASSAAGKLPAAFVFQVHPYIGLDSRQVVANLQVYPDDAKPLLALRIVAFDALLESIADEFAEKVAAEFAKLGDGIAWHVAHGTFRQNWRWSTARRRHRQVRRCWPAPARRTGHQARDDDGRLVGLAKVENWTKRRSARMGAAVSPFRHAYSPNAPHYGAPRRKPTQ